ncbi:unnamed protein product [Clonostachys chloroleuca]|uniref:FAD-binding domain-containing protein n=1 Tax=Clonostachys chloroleuca TaxID=1926264 RepID=A0AA35LWN5_9HYPO|nr:unnamed protein product [Clonostachys chloroleuca]
MGQFKVIVVGAGPVGLVLAIALQKSGIDFVVVEQRKQVPPPTAFGIFLWPHILRIFDQLGLYEDMQTIGIVMTELLNKSSTGEQLEISNGFELLEFAHGYPTMLFDRKTFAEVLLKHLKGSDQLVKTNKKVTNITSRKDGVTVDFADGTSEDGSIVVGADGVWSTVRDFMREKAPPGLFSEGPNPFSAPYQGLFFRVPRPESLKPGQTVYVHQPNRQLMALVTATEAHMTTYERIPDVSERTYFSPNKVTDEDVKYWFDVPVNEQTTFKDLWDNKIIGGRVNHDEGVIPWWHWDRLVLVGDSVHKVECPMSPFRGAGACCGIEGVISLVNKLNRTLSSNPEPSRQDLSRAFTAYQVEREPAARLWVHVSRLDIDLYTSKAGPASKAATFADGRTIPIVANSPVLDILPFPDEKEGVVPWRRHPKVPGQSKDVKARL